MKQHQRIWLPDGETHLTEWMDTSGEMVDGYGTYQIKKLREALKWVRNWRAAVDVGAHCGLWSMQLVKQFRAVHAFEPVAEHRDCFVMNVQRTNATLYPVALGEVNGSCSIHKSEGSSGDSWPEGEGDIPIKRLDDFGMRDVDFIKLDCEGFELFALRGGEETLKRCMPCVIVEQKPGRAQKFGLRETEAVDYLKSLGAILRKEMAGDFILSWD